MKIYASGPKKPESDDAEEDEWMWYNWDVTAWVQVILGR